MIGLEFRDAMQGVWCSPQDPALERPMAFSVRATVPRLGALFGNAVADLEGRIVVEGITAGADARGTLGIGAVMRERRLPYALTFRGDDGRQYRLDGAKEILVTDFKRSMATLPAYIFDDAGTEVGRVVLHVDMRGGLLAFARSWKPVRA